MPCAARRPALLDADEWLEAECALGPALFTADEHDQPWAIFVASAHNVLKELEQVRHIGDANHPTNFELEAQKALVRHAIRHHHGIRLNDDHWGYTGKLFLKLFEEGRAAMRGRSRTFRFGDLIKETWQEGFHGGFLYRDLEGVVVYKRFSWIA